MDVFTADSDPELVGSAMPLAIKMYETLLEAKPKHKGLIVSTGSLFIMYANAFVQGPAALLPHNDYEKRDEQYARAKKLYQRGAAILEQGLQLRFPGYEKQFSSPDFDTILKKMKKTDVPLVYWTVAGNLAAYSIDPLDISLGVRLPLMRSLINRAYELDPGFNNGAIEELFIPLYASLPEGSGGDKALAKQYFDQAVARQGGQTAAPFVSWAEAVAIPAQDYASFRESLETALAIDVDRNPSTRLVNILNQRKARHLLDEAEYHFYDLGDNEWEEEE